MSVLFVLFARDEPPFRIARLDREWQSRRFEIGGNERGFSLAELIIALAIALVLLSAVYSLFSTQNKQLVNQEQVAEMQQNARMAMEMMVHDIQMAGYNPTGGLPKCGGTMPSTLTNATCVGILNAASNTIKLNMDTTGSTGSGSPDGATDGPSETVTYGLYTSTAGGVSVPCLGRKTTTDSSYQPVVENIQSLTFDYRDASDGAATNIDNIREVVVTVVARTAKKDPSYAANSGYRTYTLTSKVTPRNLAY